MPNTQLSPLAEKLYAHLNATSHLYSIEIAASILMEEPSLTSERRIAYREIWEYSKNDY
jgi:hypothetical protein